MNCKNIYCIFNDNYSCVRHSTTIGITGMCEDVFLPTLPSNYFRYMKNLYRNPKNDTNSRIAKKDWLKYKTKKDFLKNLDINGNKDKKNFKN